MATQRISRAGCFVKGTEGVWAWKGICLFYMKGEGDP